MADTLRIKRRTSGAPGAPASLANAELSYNEVDHILYYGEGTGGAGGTASVIAAIAGQGLFSLTTPTMNGVGAAGSGTTWSRNDHVHPSDTSKANTASPTFSGTVTINGTITGTGVTAMFAAPPPIGATTPAAGSFTTLTASGVVSGVGFTNLLASPSPIGATTPAAGSFTTLSATGLISGAGFTAYLASPPAIGGTTPAAGNFTNITMTGTFTGAGVTASFAAPPPIGSTTPNTGSFTTLSASGTVAGAGIAALLAPYAPLAGPTHTGIVTINGTITGPGMNTFMASPPPIGSTAASTGAFTTLSVTTTVSGTGFTTFLASPPAIGGTAPNAGTFNSLTVNGTLSGAGVTAALLPYAPLASPLFSGAPSMPTGTIGVTQVNTVSNTTLATTAFVRSIRLDQFAVPTAPVSMNSQFMTNVLNPVNPQDAATKSYVDQNAVGLAAKGAVAVASVGVNLTLSGLQTLDGYTMIEGDRVLVKDQTLTQNNGIYVAHGPTPGPATWVRAQDMDAWSEVPQAYVFVTNGTVNAASSWVCNAIAGGTLGTTPITWVQFSQQASVTAGAGLTRTGNSFDVIGTTNRIVVFADNVDIDSNYVGQGSITTVGSIAIGTWNGTTIAVARGGSGATTLTGYLKGNGVSAFTASATIPNTDINGLGTMSTQFANNVAISGGTIDGVTFDCGTF